MNKVMKDGGNLAAGEDEGAYFHKRIRIGKQGRRYWSREMMHCWVLEI